MMIKRVCGIVRRAENLNPLHCQHVMDAQGRESFLGLLPDFRCGLAIEWDGDSEVACKLEVCPVIERIAQGSRHGRGPSLKFFLGRSRARDVGFGNPVRPHGSPLVVILGKPCFLKIAEAMVSCDLGWGEVVVKIDDRLILGVLMVESPSGVTSEKEIIVDKA